jgi:hypothetical protein
MNLTFSPAAPRVLICAVVLAECGPMFEIQKAKYVVGVRQDLGTSQ